MKIKRILDVYFGDGIPATVFANRDSGARNIYTGGFGGVRSIFSGGNSAHVVYRLFDFASKKLQKVISGRERLQQSPDRSGDGAEQAGSGNSGQDKKVYGRSDESDSRDEEREERVKKLQIIRENIEQLNLLSQQIREMTREHAEFLFEESPSVFRDYQGVPAINIMPLSASLTRVSKGWSFVIEERTDQKDVLRVFAEPDSELPEHVHFQTEEIQMIKGSATVFVDGAEYNLKPGDYLSIGSYQPHRVISGKDGCVCTVIFVPPITVVMAMP